MKLNNSFFYTIKEDAKNEDSVSGNLLVRSGMIKKGSSGTYMFLPLGLKVLKNIEALVRKEMNKAGANEVLMPSLTSKEVYEASGRNKTFGSSIFRLNDRYGKEFMLAPTHEEVFTMAAKMKVNSYKDLPFNIYQFQNKFRDEARPRYGLIRVREFIMKDAYSFDLHMDGLNDSYQKMFSAYKNIFDALNINYRIVKSDTGAMGGLLSEEFQAITDIGEDDILYCDKCSFSSNIDIAPVISVTQDESPLLDLEKINTPNSKSINELEKSLGINANQFIKTLLYKTDTEVIACLLPGDRELNETKLSKLLGTETLRLASLDELRELNLAVGYIGPKDLELTIIMDNTLVGRKNMVIGANEVDYHIKNANLDRDFTYNIAGDIVNAKLGDKCPICGEPIIFTKGIEIGNTFKLGTKYSEVLGLNYSNQDNKLLPVLMGSYGIGIGRTMAAIVEQQHDDKGIIWPYLIAPYKVYIVLINPKDEIQSKVANEIYDLLQDNDVEVILDDRKERPGSKFKDADLVGIPFRITVGKGAADNIVEFKYRLSSEVKEIKVTEILNTLLKK